MNRVRTTGGRRAIGVAVCMLFAFGSTQAFAQAVDEEEVIEDEWDPEPAPTYTEPAPRPAPAPAPAAQEAVDAEPESDHASMVGRTAVGFLGVASVPAGALGPVASPVLGIRHWATERAGLDLGVGIGLQRTSTRIAPDVGDSVAGPRELTFGFAAHVGLPIAIFHRRHYAFLIVPEADIGVGFGTADPDPEFGGNETDHLGVLLQTGVRFGSEVHFGFIGIPQLSLQASVGVRARYEWNQDKDAVGNRFRDHSLDFGTTLQNSPWNIFIANVAALYYF